MLFLVKSQQVLWRRYRGLNNSPLVITPINLYTSYGLSTACIDGFHESLLTLIKFLTVIGRVGIDLSFQTVGLGCTEEFLQKFSLKIGPISNRSRP